MVARCVRVVSAAGFLIALVLPAGAFETYTASPGMFFTNCAQCHGDFRASGYTSRHDGSAWGGSLHDIHRNTMLNGDCNTCHSATRNPVFLYSSNGGTGFAAISCLGCHGRGQEGGAGLRQHHFAAGETLCADCHDDANPANVTTVGENIRPAYYFTPDSAHPNKPTNPCNPAGQENSAGSSLGLDNDGDGLYDTADPDCPAVVATATATSTRVPPTVTPTNTALPRTSTPTTTATNPPVTSTVPPSNTPVRTSTNTPGMATGTPTTTAGLPATLTPTRTAAATLVPATATPTRALTTVPTSTRTATAIVRTPTAIVRRTPTRTPTRRVVRTFTPQRDDEGDDDEDDDREAERDHDEEDD